MNANEIANYAALLLGQPTNISDFPAEAAERDLVQSIYTAWLINLPKLLEQHPWNFAIRRKTILHEDGLPESSRFNLKAPLPADCARVLGLGDANPHDHGNRFEVAEGKLLFNGAAGSSVRITYVAKIDTASTFSAGFGAALGTAIARDCVIKVTGNRNRWEQLKADAEMELRKARGADAMETGEQFHNATDYQDVRYGV